MGGAGSVGGVANATGMPNAFGAPGGAPSPAMSASPARGVPTPAPALAGDVFGGDLFAAPQPQGSPARPPLPVAVADGASPSVSQTNSPARRASKSAFDDLNDSIRAALGSPAKQTGPMAAQAGAGAQGGFGVGVGAPGMPGVAGVPAGAAQFAPGLVGFGSPAKQPSAVAGDLVTVKSVACF